MPGGGPCGADTRAGSPRSSTPSTAPLSTISTDLTTAGPMSSGTSPAPVGRAAIASSVSRLSAVTTLPNTVYWPSRKFELLCTMKNCEPALSGLIDLAIETIPRSCRMSLNSASMVVSGPPVPHVLRGPGSSCRVFGSPPCIMKPLMTRWKAVPS